MFKKLYFTFVRYHLEYAVAVWAPHLVKYINIIENVQICATKLVDGFSQLEYSERLRQLDIPTLIYRRARGDMIEIFKHLHSYDKNTLPNSFQPRDRISRKHTFQLHERRPKAKYSVKLFIFLQRENLERTTKKCRKFEMLHHVQEQSG